MASLQVDEQLSGSTLTGRIHRVFERHNFRTTSVFDFDVNKPELDNDILDLETYRRIEPALRLITRAIECWQPFYETVLCATVVTRSGFNPQSRNKGGNELPETMLDPTYASSDASREHYDDTLTHISTILRIFWGKDDQWERTNCHGSSRSQLDDRCALQMQLSHETLLFFEQESYTDIPIKERQRVLLMLATTLTHELAHLIFMWRTRKQYWRMVKERGEFSSSLMEPWYQACHPSYELGHAFEEYVIGGLLMWEEVKIRDGTSPI